jgi:hypothetical protein
MNCRDITLNGESFTYCPEQTAPVADRLQAIIQGRFVDELTGAGIKAQLTVATDTPELKPRVTHDGVAGLVANPFRRFPGLLANTITVDMRINANRYLARSFARDLGPFATALGSPANYPDFFAPADLGVINLHREPSRIKGRCVQEAPVQRNPLAGVTIAITGLWRQFPASNVFPPMVMEQPLILSLQQPLYRDHSAGISNLMQRNLSLVAGEEKLLQLPVSAGKTQVRLSDRINLNPGDLLAIQPDYADLAEYIQIAAVDTSSSANQPALITLEYPMRKLHLQGVTCVRTSLLPDVFAANTLAQDAFANDQTIFLNSLIDLANTYVEISDGINAPEYHVVRLYSVLSDAQGFFRLPPLHRVAQIEIVASRADLPTPVTVVFSPNYESAENRLDLVFS